MVQLDELSWLKRCGVRSVTHLLASFEGSGSSMFKEVRLDSSVGNGSVSMCYIGERAIGTVQQCLQWQLQMTPGMHVA